MRNMITINEPEGKELERRVRAKTVAVRERQRAQIVGLAIGGMKQGQIAAEVGVSRVTVRKPLQNSPPAAASHPRSPRERSSPATEVSNLPRRASFNRMAIIFLLPSSSSVKNLALTTPPPRCFASLRPAPRTLASPTRPSTISAPVDRGSRPCKRGFRSVEWGHCGSGKPDHICSKRNNYRQRLGAANAERES
jgi:hypothetical protein